MRINLFGGPGSGKSTTAARLFADLKVAGYSIEHVGEYVKAWAYQKRIIAKFDQIYLFGKQMQYEYRYLSTGVKNIVTDSPIQQSQIYAPPNLKHALGQLIEEYEKDFPSVNIFISRGSKPYVQEGRYQTYEAAKQIDQLIKDQIGFDLVAPFQDYPMILDFVKTKLN